MCSWFSEPCYFFAECEPRHEVGRTFCLDKRYGSVE